MKTMWKKYREFRLWLWLLKEEIKRQIYELLYHN